MGAFIDRLEATPWLFGAARAVIAFGVAGIILASLDASSAWLAFAVAGWALIDLVIVTCDIGIVAADGVRIPRIAIGVADAGIASFVIAAPPIAAEALPSLWTMWALAMGTASIVIAFRTDLRSARWPALFDGLSLLGGGAISGLVPLAGTYGLALLIAGAALFTGLARAAGALHVARAGDIAASLPLGGSSTAPAHAASASDEDGVGEVGNVPRDRIVFLALVVAIFIDQSAGGILTSTLPFAIGTFDGTANDATALRVAAYSPYFTTIAVAPTLLRRFGAQWVLFIGLVGCAAAATVIATASTFSVFAVARVAFGIAQGGLFVSAALLLLASPWPRTTWVRIACLSATSLGGPALSSFIAGVATDTDTWRSAVWFVVVLSTFAAVATPRVVFQKTEGRRNGGFDFLGPTLLLAAIASLEIAVQFGPQWDWLSGGGTIQAFCCAALSGAGFVVVSTRRRFPSVQLRPLLHRNVAVAVLLALTLGIPLFSIADLLTFVSEVLGFTPTEGGLLLALRLVPIAFVAPLVTYLMIVRGVDQRVIVPIAMATTACAYALGAMRTTTNADFEAFVVPVFLSGVGFSGLFSPVASLVIGSVPREDFPYALAAFKLALAVAGPTSTPFIATFVDHRMRAHLSDIAGDISPAHERVAAITAEARAHLTQLVTAQAQTMAFADVTLLVAALGILAAPLVLFMKRTPPHIR